MKPCKKLFKFEVEINTVGHPTEFRYYQYYCSSIATATRWLQQDVETRLDYYIPATRWQGTCTSIEVL